LCVAHLLHMFAEPITTTMKNQRFVKPHTTDCYGNHFTSLSIGQLLELRNAISLEVRTYSFHNETIRYQKKQRATLEYLFELTMP